MRIKQHKKCMKFMKRKMKGFTLVETIITLILITLLSLLSAPIYKSIYSPEKASDAEALALLSTVKHAQINYYNEYGYFLNSHESFGGHNIFTTYDPVLGISAAHNKYWTAFKYDQDPNWAYRSNKTAICVMITGNALRYKTFKQTVKIGVSYPIQKSDDGMNYSDYDYKK